MSRPSPASPLLALLAVSVLPGLPTGCHTIQKADPVDSTAPATPCEPQPPPAEAIVQAGEYDGILVLPDGRALTPAGIQTDLGGFPADVAIATTATGLRVGLVTNAARSSRTLDVVSIADGALLTEIDRTDAFPGYAVDGQTIYASGGNSNLVDVYHLEDDGTVTLMSSLAPGEYPTGLQLSADRTRLYVALFSDQGVAEVDVATGTVLRTFDTTFNTFGLAISPDGKTLWATGFGDTRVAVIDVASGESDLVTVGGNPEGVVVAADGTAFVAVSNEDEVVVLDGVSHAQIGSIDLKEDAISSDEGALPGTSPSSLAFSSDGSRLYVARASDNAVGVIDVASQTLLGNIPTAWYPTGLAVSPNADGTDTLLVSNGKGVGTGSNADGTFVSDAMVGTSTIVTVDPTDDAQLATWTQAVADNLARPNTLYDFGTCDGTFPIPRPGGDAAAAETPIKHVILVVRENKTYDSLLGDLDTTPASGIDSVASADPSLSAWPQLYTPNLHAFAQRFTSHDNFYDNSESSVQGHLWLTSSMVSEYMERAWIEDYHGVSQFADDGATSVGRPEWGTIFTHLLTHGVDVRDYGEVVGTLDSTTDGVSVLSKTDLNYPGGFFNTSVPDEDKANYVVQQLFQTPDNFPPFVYISLPNDHTGGAYCDSAMIADNDYATGLLVQGLSNSDYWKDTVMFVVEDDPQSNVDHIDAHRSILMVMSPWARRAHTSHVMASYPSVFRTIEAILGVPAMNRYDALATPLYDAFTSTPDYTPYTALPRNIDNDGNVVDSSGATSASRRSPPPDAIPPNADPRALKAAAEARKCLDLSEPDRDPYVLDINYAERFGRFPVKSILAQTTDCTRLRAWSEARSDDDDGGTRAEREADLAWTTWEAAHPGSHRPSPPTTDPD